MNRTYYILKEMDDLTEDNFLDKIRDITTFEFNEKQLNMLKTDIFNESNEK